ncbi:glycine/betaine ABC transporter substrate-binding protein [Rhodovibrio sodomensis]|uniref:Glycine/betaine ABC transporter substrate-binding protein n=1 Tax=Rhodovibrio sodomensis TaxID=1088 RepID=A0ABS1D9X8_9PROT|nr:glycine betaine ABC transporter substrate-binding protein [Rhodovibrio sodomensis]MBK1667231.1 glycine/betaine ABC transporter substrate-binding protein [Rhodovibrio sodomensis]
MLNHSKKTLIAATTAVTLAASPAAAEVEIGWTAWSDAEFVTKLAHQVLENRVGEEVTLTQTGIAPQYQGVAQGDIDVMLMSWLPSTHADYMDRVEDEVVSLGILYDHARLGWVVPTYMNVDSINDLKSQEMAEKLDGTITGIDPGAGLTRLSKKAIKEYGLGEMYNLQTSSGAGMTAALERAVRREEPIVVTGWSPHWKFGAYDLKYLKDPKNTLGSFERIHAIARQGFYQDNIDAAMTLARMWIPLDDLQAAMYDAQETSYEEAVDTYIKNNEARVHYWVTGEMPSQG